MRSGCEAAMVNYCYSKGCCFPQEMKWDLSLHTSQLLGHVSSKWLLEGWSELGKHSQCN